MRGRWFAVFAVVALLLVGLVPFVQAQEDLLSRPRCKYCGMNREKFAHSRMLIDYEDGTTVGLCSLHCVALDLAMNMDKVPKTFMVGDFYTKQLIDAEGAYWVIGGSKMGVMSQRGKWAFEKKEDAAKFIKENGGKKATFDQAMKAAFEDMYSDTKAVRDKMKMMKRSAKQTNHKS